MPAVKAPDSPRGKRVNHEYFLGVEWRGGSCISDGVRQFPRSRLRSLGILFRAATELTFQIRAKFVDDIIGCVDADLKAELDGGGPIVDVVRVRDGTAAEFPTISE